MDTTLVSGETLLQVRTWYAQVSGAYFKATLPFFLTANGFYLLVLIAGFINARRRFADKNVGITRRLSPLRSLKPVSILVPAFNEEKTIVHAVETMLRLDYPEFEIVVINDGSSDGTLAGLLSTFGMVAVASHLPAALSTAEVRAVYRSRVHRHLVVIDKANGGKADALNAGINQSQYPLICCVDSDSVIEAEGLARVSMPFIESARTIATGGTILLANPRRPKDDLRDVNPAVPARWIGMIQCVEYIRAFLVGRLGWDQLGSNCIISGAFGMFKKSMVVKVGGYSRDTLGEDMELLLRLQSWCIRHGQPYEVRLLPDPVCWTEPPSDLRSLASQRRRWTQGLAESLWLHRDLMLRPRARVLGMFALPYQLLFELVAAPVEILGYLIIVFGLALGVFDPWQVAAFLAATILFGCILNLAAILIDQATFQKYGNTRDLGLLIAAAILEHFGFRQLHLYWRLSGIIRWLRGKRQWGAIRRVGIGPRVTAGG